MTYYLLDTTIGRLPDEWGYYVTLGLQFDQGIFLEGSYRDVSGTINTTASGNIPVDLSGASVNLGYRFGKKD